MNDIFHFTKMHGLGNDYIYLNTMDKPMLHPEAAARTWSKPHTGIGSDGLVLIGWPLKTKDADFSMRIFNADGSEAMMCGNAARCIGKFLYEKEITRLTNIRLETLAGIRTLQLHVNQADEVESVTVDMGVPTFSNHIQYIPENDNATPNGILPLKGTFVSMGNPHYVVFVDNVADTDVATLGRQMEHHRAFPERCNIEFAQLMPDGSIRMRVWERGSGITMACGTGACATAVATQKLGLTRGKTIVVMDGGRLTVEWNHTDNHVYMTGEAAIVFEGDIEWNDDQT